MCGKSVHDIDFFEGSYSLPVMSVKRQLPDASIPKFISAMNFLSGFESFLKFYLKKLKFHVSFYMYLM